MPIYGGFQKARSLNWHGRSYRIRTDHWQHDQLGNQLLFARAKQLAVFTHSVIYCSDCGCSAIYRDGDGKKLSAAVPNAGHFLATYYHQLRSTRHSATERTSQQKLYRIWFIWLWGGTWFLYGVDFIRQHA